MKTIHIKLYFVVLLVITSVSCSYIDYVNNDSICIFISDSTLDGKEIRKGELITFYLNSWSNDSDFPCYELKNELFIDDKKNDIPGDTGDLTNSVLVTISTADLSAGEHIMKIRSSGCNDMESTRIIKFTIVDGAPPVAKITNTKIIAEPAKYNQLQIYVHYSASIRPIKTITLYSWGLEGTFDDKALDTINIEKLEGDTLFTIYLYTQDKYVLSLLTDDDISSNFTDTIEYKLNYTVPTDDVIITNTTWTKANSPYIIYDTLELRGATLTIEPGVVVRMGPDSKIIVHSDAGSALVAEGTSVEPIYFSSEYNGFKGIDINAYSSFKYCNIGRKAKINVTNTTIGLENCKVDSVVLDKNSSFSFCNNSLIEYLSIDASKVNTIGSNNTVVKQIVTNKK